MNPHFFVHYQWDFGPIKKGTIDIFLFLLKVI